MTEAAGRIGANIRRLRKGLGWTQKQLSDKARIHQTQVSQYETAMWVMNVNTLARFAQALEVPPGVLFVSPCQPSGGEALTPMELFTVKLVASGARQNEVAERLGQSEGSVNNRMYRIGQKLGTHNAIQTVMECVRRGWIDPGNLP